MRWILSLVFMMITIASFSQEPYQKEKARRDRYSYRPINNNIYDGYCYDQPPRRYNRAPYYGSGPFMTMSAGAMANFAINNADGINCFGAYLSIGGARNRVMLGYSESGFRGYPYYGDISYQQVLLWQDLETNRFDRFSDVFIALVLSNRYQINPIIGLGFEQTDLIGVFYDELHILARDGQYAISIDQQIDTNIKLGIEKNLNHLNILAIYSISQRPGILIGVGFYF